MCDCESCRVPTGDVGNECEWCRNYIEATLARLGLVAAGFIAKGMYARVYNLANTDGTPAGVVLKVTSDRTEAALAWHLSEIQKRGLAESFVRVHHVKAIPCTEHEPRFLEVVERLRPMPDAEKGAYSTVRVNSPSTYHSWADPANDLAVRYNVAGIQASMREADVGYMADLHGGNVMWRDTPEGPRLVVSDLGQSSSPHPVPVARAA